jgi:hypothetical protein
VIKEEPASVVKAVSRNCRIVVSEFGQVTVLHHNVRLWAAVLLCMGISASALHEKVPGGLRFLPTPELLDQV